MAGPSSQQLAMDDCLQLSIGLCFYICKGLHGAPFLPHRQLASRITLLFGPWHDIPGRSLIVPLSTDGLSFSTLIPEGRVPSMPVTVSPNSNATYAAPLHLSQQLSNPPGSLAPDQSPTNSGRKNRTAAYEYLCEKKKISHSLRIASKGPDLHPALGAFEARR